MVEMWGQDEIEMRDRINAEKKWYEEGSNNCVFTRLRCDRGNLKNPPFSSKIDMYSG